MFFASVVDARRLPCEAVQAVIVVVVMLLLCFVEGRDDRAATKVMSRMYKSRW